MSRCAACLAELPADSRYCPSCATPVGATTSLPTRTSTGSVPVSLPSDRRSRFIPGAIVAQRYRIVGLVGRGGMGEVYHADDLKLGQPVALKFLPPELEQDEERLGRLLNEVKLARQISHPAICRVYDVGEVDGQHYLSMEYVDGEDLASLLRRVGHLPKDKAVVMARQLCAGLAAAHNQGILHRDLKPANVMVDGRGRAKITDFGLAAIETQVKDLRSGTPTYMAPEQLEGMSVSVRSDIYSLGLVLYELFTGKRAFDAPSAAELRRLQLESAPTSPASYVEGFDPAVERVILQCLEKLPEDRPASALAVAAGLPGGDPLAAALAAGETPSPEMVAAAGPRGGLRPGLAAACLGLAVVGLIVQTLTADGASPLARVSLTKSFQVLRENARQIAEQYGHAETTKDRVAYFDADIGELNLLVREKGIHDALDTLGEPGQLVLQLFYRQGRGWLIPGNLIGAVTLNDPPNGPGQVAMTLDLQGNLAFLRATPPERDEPGAPGSATDWEALFRTAGLDLQSFEPITPTFIPGVYADERVAWTGVLPDYADRPVRVEAAAWRGKPVYFEKVIPSDSQWRTEADARESGLNEAAFWVLLGLILLIVAGATFVTVRNLMLGRGDRKGALRLAAFVFALRLMQWLLTGHHVPHIGEIYLLIVALSGALALALLAWVLYIAIEPYLRRLWPEALVAWNRLVAGRYRDPLVGRDVLIGFAVMAVLASVMGLAFWAATSAGVAPLIPKFSVGPLRGGRFVVGELFSSLLVALPFGLAIMMLVLLLRIVLRKTWIAAAALCLIWGAQAAVNFGALGGSSRPAMLFGFLAGLINMAVILTLLIRFGLVATTAGLAMAFLLDRFPITGDVSAPYFSAGLLGLLTVVGLAALAFRISLAGRPLFRDEFGPQT